MKCKRRLICAFLMALLFCVSPLSLVAFANETEVLSQYVDNKKTHVSMIEGYPSYFEKSEDRTITAIAYSDVIDCNLVYASNPNVVYRAILLREEYTSSLTEVTEWNEIIRDALPIMTIQGGLIDNANNNVNNEDVQALNIEGETVSIFELFLDEIEKVYGTSGTSYWVSIMRMYYGQEKYVYIKEYYDANVEYWGEKTTFGDIGVAALAALLGVIPCTITQGLGMAVDYVIPHGSTFELYLCTAAFERVCMVGTSISNMEGVYYRSSAELIHVGILDPTNLYDHAVAMEQTTKFEFYDPSEEVFKSDSELARLTKLSYES